MYKYYNDLIYRQNDGSNKFEKPMLPEIHSLKPRSISPNVKENFSLNARVFTPTKDGADETTIME